MIIIIITIDNYNPWSSPDLLNYSSIYVSSTDNKLMMKQLAFMLARQQIFLELDEDMEDNEDLTEILSNTHLNNNFLALAREVCG